MWFILFAAIKASGLIGVWPDKAVTMLDNHDTGPVPYGQNLWIFPGSKVLNSVSGEKD